MPNNGFRSDCWISNRFEAVTDWGLKLRGGATNGFRASCEAIRYRPGFLKIQNHHFAMTDGRYYKVVVSYAQFGIADYQPRLLDLALIDLNADVGQRRHFPCVRSQGRNVE